MAAEVRKAGEKFDHDAAQLGLTAKRHLELLEAEERSRLAGLVRQSRDAWTAMVIESSSQLAIERSPFARPRNPAANHVLASYTA